MGLGLGATRLTTGAPGGTPGNDHLGSAAVQEVQLFGMLGLSPRVNALVILPYVRWSQTPHEEDAHHRNETIQGLRDARLGLRFVVTNTPFGPGERLFLGLTLALPTAPSYAGNPFAAGADTVDHRHFTLGNGTACAPTLVAFGWRAALGSTWNSPRPSPACCGSAAPYGPASPVASRPPQA